MIRALALSRTLTAGLNDVDISNMLERKCCWRQSPPLVPRKTELLACEICVVEVEEEEERGCSRN